MSLSLSARACQKRALYFSGARHLPQPALVAARLGALPSLRMALTVPRGQTIDTNYNADPSAYEAENVSIEDIELANPGGVVGDIMTSKNLRSTQPDQTLRSADSKLDKITGLPVVDADNVVVGVISKKDINRLKKQGVSFDLPVSQYMSTPPLVVQEKAKIGEAAAIMLDRKIHRLCVVDGEGKLLGIVSRTDIFKPLLQSEKDTYDMLYGLGADGGSVELQAAIQKSIDFDVQERAAPQEDWVVKYLYDGDCSMCLALMSMLKRQDAGRNLINFVNIASFSYNPRENEGIEYEEAMETIHAIKRDGTIITGPDALKELYSTVGLGWAAALGNLPIVSALADWLYEVLSKLRMPMGKGLDAVLAMRRMKMTSDGIEHCVDDEEECQAEW